VVQGQPGLTDEVKDANDPNKDNHSAFSLALKGVPGSVYASPFTSRASSRSIEDVALLHRRRRTARIRPCEGRGVPERDPYHLESPRQSNAATADKIKADYSSLNGWATGLTVQEVIPVTHDEWAASIGLNQNVVYRVLVKSGGSSCLTNAGGAPIRCIDSTGKTIGPDNTQNAGGTDAGTAPTCPAAQVGGLSNEDLAKLQDAVTKEVLKRLSAAKQ
jgi:hypothetical protein